MKKDKIQLIIIIVELIILIGLSSYRVYEYIIKDKEEIKENESGNENIKKYKVTFDYGNNSIRSIEVKENDKIELPQEPIKEGYKFGGWLNNYTLIDKNYVVKEDITLKINWIDEKLNSGIKILVYQINIRKEANETSEDIGDVLLDETYEVLEVIDSSNYTWYKIKQGNIIGYVANQKGENWVEYSDNSLEVNNKVLYFYEQDGNLYVDEENNNKNYIGSYQCKSDSCYGFSYMHNKYDAQLYNVNNNTSVVIDSNWFLYNYQEQKRISEYYNFFNDCGEYVSAKKEDKWILLDYSGKELSKYYDFIGNYGYTKNVIEYENNNKHGLLSLKDGSNITEAIYDSVSIFQDNIVASIDDLEYVMAENGNIISRGYETVMWSNNELIVICENNLIDIIDYSGKSKIEDKINTFGFSYSRMPGHGAQEPRISINFKDDKLKISIPNVQNYIESTYIYNIKTEELTIEEY